MTEQLAAAAAEAALEEAALETALQHRQAELEDARAELGAVSSAAQIASSLLAVEIGGLEAQCEHKVRHSRELAMSWRRECDEAEAAAALGTARAEAAAREAEAALETARAEAAALRTALERERQGASEREQRAARDLDEMTSSRLELQMTISRLEHQLTEQRQQLTEQLTQSEREWSEGTALLRAQLELDVEIAPRA